MGWGFESPDFQGSFADAGHVYVHVRAGSIGEQLGGKGRFSYLANTSAWDPKAVFPKPGANAMKASYYSFWIPMYAALKATGLWCTVAALWCRLRVNWISLFLQFFAT